MQAILIALRRENTIDHALGIFDPGKQLFRATTLFKSRQTIGTNLSMFIDVGHSTHQRTENDFGVILKEVDLGEQMCEGEETKASNAIEPVRCHWTGRKRSRYVCETKI